MAKTVLRRKVTASVAQDQIDNSLAVLAARKQFVGATMNMGWQLAGAVLLPVILGTWLDNRYDTDHSFTLGSMVIATGMVVKIVMATLASIKKEQQETELKEKASTND